jgi:hypothetical protein
MSTSDQIIADLLAIAHDGRSPEAWRVEVDRRLTAFRAELDRWGASEPTDDDLLRDKGEDLNERLAERLADPSLDPGEREVLNYALDSQREATSPNPTA